MDTYGNQNLFGTTANVYQDTFSNPINSANMNSGWGINPNLLTPSYQAPYRPAYVGSTGYSPYGNPGYFQSMRNMFGPGHDPYWGNPVDSIQPSVHSASTKPFDAAMWGMQNVAMPYMGYTGVAKILSPATSNLWRGVNTGFRGSTVGQGIGEIGALGRDMWQGKGVAAGLGRGFGEGVAGAFTSNATARGLVGGMTGLASGIAAPLILGQMATSALNAGFVDPYVNSRRNADAIQRNFSNIYFGENNGNVVSGKGLSRSATSRMGVDIMHQGLNDMMFSREEYGDIADMGQRAGLFDNVKSSKITQRVKDVAEQVKLLVSISNDPDIRNAIEELSKLNLAGADVSGGRLSTASNAYQHLGGFAAMAGTSIRKMMDTVGAQGQYLFQSNGMTPYLGQLAAANSYAGFSAAQRSGLLSSAMMARMGGLDGATQGSLTAQVIGAQTPYAMMGAYNKYVGGLSGAATGGKNQSITATLSNFGSLAAGNPMEMSGNMDLYGQAAAGAAMTEQGSMGLQNQAESIMQSLGIAGSGKNGQFSAGQLMAVLTRQMGIPADQARAYIMQRSGEQDKGAHAIKMSAVQGYSAEQSRQFINQNMLGAGLLDRAVRGGTQVMHSMGDRFAESVADPMARAAGDVGDAMTGVSDWWNYGRTIKNKNGLVIDDMDKIIEGSKNQNETVKQFAVDYGELTNTNPLESGYRNIKSVFSQGTLNKSGAHDISRKINELAKSSDPEAAKRASRYIMAKTPEERKAAMDQLMAHDSGALGKAKDFLGNGSDSASPDQISANRDYMDKIVSGLIKTDEKSGEGNEAKEFRESIANTVGQVGYNDRLADLQTIGAAASFSKRLVKGGEGNSEADIAKEILEDKTGQYSGLIKAGGKSTDAIVKAIKGINGSAVENGLTGMGTAALKLGMSEKDLLALTPEKRDELLKKIGMDRGGAIYNTKFAGAGDWSLKKQVEAQNLAENSDSLFKQTAEQYRKGLTNFENVREKFGNIDKTTTFAMAVDKFATSVDKINKSSNDDGFGWIRDRVPGFKSKNHNAQGTGE